MFSFKGYIVDIGVRFPAIPTRPGSCSDRSICAMGLEFFSVCVFCLCCLSYLFTQCYAALFFPNVSGSRLVFRPMYPLLSVGVDFTFPVQGFVDFCSLSPHRCLFIILPGVMLRVPCHLYLVSCCGLLSGLLDLGFTLFFLRLFSAYYSFISISLSISLSFYLIVHLSVESCLSCVLSPSLISRFLIHFTSLECPVCHVPPHSHISCIN